MIVFKSKGDDPAKLIDLRWPSIAHRAREIGEPGFGIENPDPSQISPDLREVVSSAFAG